MPNQKAFIGFFSYAHHDAETDPALIPAFTTALENRVNAKLLNARLEIWRDRDGLRAGDRWDARIEAQVREADVLIALLTPKWVESPYCLKEYMIFEEVEAGREIGEYVAPILVRTIERQEIHLTLEQREVYERIKMRQYQIIVATDFVKLSDVERTAIIDKIADDIEGMIDRLRVLSTQSNLANYTATRAQKSKAFDFKAQNYEKVDFVTDGEVVLNRPGGDGQRDVLAHVGFIERLYVQGKRGRIEFGVRRAFLSISNRGSGSLSKIEELKAGGNRQSLYYANLHDAPGAVTVCIDPAAGKSSLAELPMPPAKNENYLSKIAIASAELTPSQIKADLMVSLNAEGLYLLDEPDISPRAAAAIKAIMDVAKVKAAASNNQAVDSSGQFHRELPVHERP